MFSILNRALSRVITSFGNKFCLKKRSRLIKALDNRFYIKFMQLEIGLFYKFPEFSRFVVTLEMEFLIYSLPSLKNNENKMPLFTVS